MVTDGGGPADPRDDDRSAGRDEDPAAPTAAEGSEQSGDPGANVPPDTDDDSTDSDLDDSTDLSTDDPTDPSADGPTDPEDAGPRAPGNDEPTDEEIVAAASEAAEGVVFSRYRRSDVRDVDVTVGFEGGVLSVDVYLNVPDADVEEHVDEEAEQVADDAALAAVDAVDRLFDERGE